MSDVNHAVQTALDRLEAAIPPDGPMPEHDAMCRIYSGWPDQQEKGCNCSIADRAAGREALATVRAELQRLQDDVASRREHALDLNRELIATLECAEAAETRVREVEKERDAWAEGALKERVRVRALQDGLRETHRIALNGDDHAIPDPLARLDAIESVARALFADSEATT